MNASASTPCPITRTFDDRNRKPSGLDVTTIDALRSARTSAFETAPWAYQRSTGTRRVPKLGASRYVHSMLM